MEDRSIGLHQKYLEASSRFDYLVLAILAAMLAYIGEGINPRQLAPQLNAFNAELASLLALLLALVSGFKRVEWNVAILALNAEFLDSSERRGKLMQVALEGRPALNLQSGDIRSPLTAAEQAVDLAEQILRLRARMDSLSDLSLSYYKWRNRLFLIGFALLITARVLSAYE